MRIFRKIFSIFIAVSTIVAVLNHVFFRKIEVSSIEKVINPLLHSEVLKRKKNIENTEPSKNTSVQLGSGAVVVRVLGIAALASPMPIAFQSMYLKRIPLIKLQNIFKDCYGEKLIFDTKLFETLLSKKTDPKLIQHFIKVLDNVYYDQAVFRRNSIVVNSSINILEVKLVKDWRVYVRKEGDKYIIYNLGHKNTQIKDIRYLKRRVLKSVS